MRKKNVRNERVKREYFIKLKEANGLTLATIMQVERAIRMYEEFSDYEDFDRFKNVKALEFKKWLKARHIGRGCICLSMYCYQLKSLKKYFTWLAGQPGYRRKLRQDWADFFNPSNKEDRIASQPAVSQYPDWAHVRKLINSIKGQTEIDRRDRALISFMILSGMRVQSILSLPVKCFDVHTLTVYQSPRDDVKTKFSKTIWTILMVFNKNLVKHLKAWVEYLKSVGYGDDDPLFPGNKLEHCANGISFIPATKVSNNNWENAESFRDVLRKRSEAGGLPYFPPHGYRHLAVFLALKAAKNGEQLKAISQNFGHEFVATTLQVYGNLDVNRLRKVIAKVDFIKALEEDDEDSNF